MGSAVFTTVKSVQSQVGNPIRVPTHYQPNNKARPGAIRYSGRPFTSHHLQPILPRPAIENKFTPPQNFNKQPEKLLEPKVRRYTIKYHVVSLYIENLSYYNLLSPKSGQQQFSPNYMNTLKREGFENHENDHQQENSLILLQTLPTTYMEITWENLYLDK